MDPDRFTRGLSSKQKGERGDRRLELTDGDIHGSIPERRNDRRGDVLR